MSRSPLAGAEKQPSGLYLHREAGCLLAPPDRVKPVDQPRTNFNQEKLERLKSDVLDLAARGRGIAGTGFLQAMLMRWAPGSLDAKGEPKTDATLIPTEGERRWRIAWDKCDPTTGIVDIPWLPVVIDDMNALEAYDAAIRSSIHRSDLEPMEEALAFEAKMKREGWGKDPLARHYNISTGYVEARLRVLGFGDDIQSMINRRPDTLSVARVINKVKNERVRARLIKDAVAGTPSREIEERAKLHYGRDTPAASSSTAVMPRVDVEVYFDNASRNLREIADALAAVNMSKKFYVSKVNKRLKECRALLDRIGGAEQDGD